MEDSKDAQNAQTNLNNKPLKGNNIEVIFQEQYDLSFTSI
jgi:hypothetical protein